MNAEEIGKIVGIASSVGALVGGLTSFIINWWWKLRAESDHIQVRYGQAFYDQTPGYSMHVINRSNHKVELTNYGFVLKDGLLYSMPVHWADGIGDEESGDMVRGKPLLYTRNDLYEIQVRFHNKDVIGAFACTSTQRCMSFDFSRYHSVSLVERFRVRAKHWRGPKYA